MVGIWKALAIRLDGVHLNSILEVVGLGKEWKMSRRDDKVKEVTKYVALHLNLSHSLQLRLILRKQ